MGFTFDVSRCGTASRVTSSVSNMGSVYTVNFGGGFESQLHFPWCYYHPYPKKGFKIHYTFLECQLYAQLCCAQEGMWLRAMCTGVLLERHFKYPYSGSTPGISAVGDRALRTVWSPVQWWSKEIFFELRSERGMLGGGRQLQMRATAISVHLNLSTIAWRVEMLPGISLVD